MHPCSVVSPLPASDAVRRQFVTDIANPWRLDQQAPRGDWEQYYRDLIKRIERWHLLIAPEGFSGATHTPAASWKSFRVCDGRTYLR